MVYNVRGMRENSFSEGMRRIAGIVGASLRATAVPMLVLWLVAAALAVAYYAFPPFASALEPLLRWQKESGWVAAALNRLFFYGLLPGIFQWTIPSLRPRRLLLTIFAQGAWCALFGVAVDFFYRLLTFLFGDGRDFATLAAKTFMNQFVWTTFVLAPANAVFYFWVARDFSARRFREEWPEEYVTRTILPNLLTNWCVWIPVNFAVFAFPLPLQVQLSGVVGAFWTLMCLQLGARSK